MAKRKRKVTLFDVINTGQPIGMTVKNRSVAPIRPDRAGGLLGRGGAAAGRSAKPTAAEELANLRRELDGRTAASADVDSREVPQTQASAPDADRTPAVVVPPRVPKLPRKPIGESARDAWRVVAPRVNDVAAATWRGVRAVGRGATAATAASWQQARRVGDLDTRYLLTAGVGLAAIALLAGTFYVGRLLAHRPANDVTDATTLAGGVRPDVLNLASAVRGGDASASLADRSQPKLSQSVESPKSTPAPAAFGGRDPSLNYVVIARYDTAVDAAAAVDVLAKYEVKSTVEKNLPHWEKEIGRDRFYVVGADGFARVSGTMYQAYLAKLARVSDREAGASLPAKLTPGAYKYLRSPAA